MENVKDESIIFGQYHNVFSRSDNDIAVDKLLRTRRQNVGGVPEAYLFNLTNENHRFGQVIYSGEGSKVNHLTYNAVSMLPMVKILTYVHNQLQL